MMKQIKSLYLAAPLLVTLGALCLTQLSAEVSFPKVGPEPLSTIPKDAIVLHEGWQMRESAIVGIDGSVISKTGYQTEGWYSATMPDTALGVLVRHGVYPDPYIGMNNMKIPDASDAFNKRYSLAEYSHMPDGSNPWAKPYWFRREIELPLSYGGQTIWLNLDGINYRADVWLNGRLVAGAEELVGMFKRFRLNVTDYVRPGRTNVLAVAVHPVDHPGDPVEAQLGSLGGGFGPNSGDGEILRDVTRYQNIGWDWIPACRDRSLGMWQHVSINATGWVNVSDPAAVTDVTVGEETTADVTVRFFAENTSKDYKLVDVVVDIGNPEQTEVVASLRHKMAMTPGSRREIILKPGDFEALRMKNPRLWWPVNYGEQPLYHLKVTARIDGIVSSEASSRFGVREVSSYILPSGGRAFKVNDRPVRIAGGAWVTDLLFTWDAQRYRDEVRLMAEGNATLVRVNGCSVMPPDVFLDACDEYGLLVWQDFSRTSATGEGSEVQWNWTPKRCDPNIYLDNMIDFISRARGHSSILLWCGCNEAVPQKDITVALEDYILPEMDGTRIFIASSSEQPTWPSLEIKTYTGGPWGMVRLPEYYEFYDKRPEFESRNEIGLASLPPINSLAQAIPDFDEPWDEYFPLNQSMGYHDAVGRGNGQFWKYVEIMHEDIGKPSSIAEKLRWGDLYNNQAYRTIFEASNRARPRNDLNVLWKSNAAWLSFFWQIYDWYLRPNAGYYTMKSALAPLHVQFSHVDKGLQVISILNEDVAVEVKVSVYRADGSLVGSETQKTLATAHQTVHLKPIPELVSGDGIFFVAMDLLDEDGKLRDRTVTWTQKDTKWQELLQIPPVDLEVGIKRTGEEADEAVFQVTTTNKGSVPVINAMLELTDGEFGKEVLPSFWSNNALTLVPGESASVEVRVRKNLLPEKLHVVAEGLNVKPVSWDAANGQKKSVEFRFDDLKVVQGKENPELHFNSSLAKQTGTRIVTAPVPLTVDGELYRYVSVAAQPGGKLQGRIQLPDIKAGARTIRLGAHEIKIP